MLQIPFAIAHKKSRVVSNAAAERVGNQPSSRSCSSIIGQVYGRVKIKTERVGFGSDSGGNNERIVRSPCHFGFK